MPLDYETLRVIWWLLLGVLLIGFAVMDGFDLGVAILLPFVGTTDTERRVLINTVGPVWEGNQVWFVLGGGAIFAAWPPLYATAFSGFYIAMFLVLAALILRPVGFTFRGKLQNRRWRATWDWALFLGGFVPALVFGIAVGNVLQGVPFHFTEDMLPVYGGGFLGLLNPFGLLCGLLSVAMLTAHAASYLAIKTGGAVAERVVRFGSVAGVAAALLFALGGLWVTWGIDGYRVASTVVTDGPSAPLRKAVESGAGLWLANFNAAPWTLVAPALGLFAMLAGVAMLRARRGLAAFCLTALALAGIIGTVGLSMFPFILPSSSDPRSSLLVWDASSSHLTLFVMLVVTALFMPVVLLYTAWVFRVLRGKVTGEGIESDSQAY